MKRPATRLHFGTVASRHWTLLLVLIASLFALPRMAPAIEIVKLNGDIANSSSSNYGMTVDVTLNDPFAYDPLSPTSPLPNQAHPNGFHGTEANDVDVLLSYDMITQVALDAGEQIFVDVWGRNECCFDRDDNFDVEFYNGGVGGTLIASVTGQAIPDPDPQYVRVSYTSTATVTIDSLRIVGHDSAVDNSNLFTLMETRAATPDGDLLSFDFSINRDTREISLTNNLASGIDILGYSITSNYGALDQTNWDPITGRLDVTPPNGDGSVDSNDRWVVLTAAGSHEDLSEAQLGGPGPQDGGVITVGSTINFGEVWIPSPSEDLKIEVLASDGTYHRMNVLYTGNGDSPFERSDLDFDGDIDPDDWATYIAGSGGVFPDLSLAQAYQMGDLNGDRMNDLADMGLFTGDYDAFNGDGSFAAMLAGVPEPSSFVMLLLGAAVSLIYRAKRK